MAQIKFFNFAYYKTDKELCNILFPIVTKACEIGSELDLTMDITISHTNDDLFLLSKIQNFVKC